MEKPLVADQAHYNQRHVYYSLLNKYINKQIDLSEFNVGFGEIYTKTRELISDLRLNREKSKSFIKTSKSKDFESVVIQIWSEVYEPELQYDMLAHLNLDEEEIEELRENELRNCFKRIATQMEAYLRD